VRAVIQRVSEASVISGGRVLGRIGHGLLLLLGIETGDNEEDVEWLVKKIIDLRIFGDAHGQMNLSVTEVSGEMLIVSQFTLHANTRKGNRPSFVRAAKPEVAIPLYNRFIERARQALGKRVATGEFRAMMQVHLVNDGPVTIIIDSKQRDL
jgi:D-tyrosyl-tRNA(Tyr) deacylase